MSASCRNDGDVEHGQARGSRTFDICTLDGAPYVDL